MSRPCLIEAKRVVCVAHLALAFLTLHGRTPAATITNVLVSRWWPQYSLAVNAGDTVVWLNEQPLYLGTNYVESYGGEWKSPWLNPGDSFSFTFTNPGFYAYRTGCHGEGSQPLPGTVAVAAWTNAPPAVTINTPVAGFVLSMNGRGLVQASVTNTEGPAEMQYFANSSFIGIATNPPYGILWTGATQGQYLLVAKAIDRQGGAACSQPVSVTVEPFFGVWGAKPLPTGELVVFYNAFPVGGPGLMIWSSDSVFMTNPTPLTWAFVPAVFVDESLRGTPVPRRFYSVW